jgi:hypothetical protein
MKRYSVILFVIVVIGFSIPVIIFYKACTYVPYQLKPQVFYLNTERMKESSVDDTSNGPAVDAIFPCNKINNINDSIPWADMYVCHTFNKSDSLVILLDTHTRKDLADIGDPHIYWTGIKLTRRFDKCKILIPPGVINKLKKYHYRYGIVTLVTDD